MCVCERERGPGWPHEGGTSGRVFVILRDGGGGVETQADRQTDKQVKRYCVCVCERDRQRERERERERQRERERSRAAS